MKNIFLLKPIKITLVFMFAHCFFGCKDNEDNGDDVNEKESIKNNVSD